MGSSVRHPGIQSHPPTGQYQLQKPLGLSPTLPASLLALGHGGTYSGCVLALGSSGTQPTHQHADTSLRTTSAPQPTFLRPSQYTTKLAPAHGPPGPWTCLPPPGMLMPALGLFRFLSQKPWDPALPTSGLIPGLGLPGPCKLRPQDPSPPTSELALGSGHPGTWS